LYWTSLPSFSCEMPYCAETCAPSKSSFRMKLTTPETASAPYTAEAPPVMISTRSIRPDGRIEMSTAPLDAPGTRRRPLTRVRPRDVPSWRRSRKAEPPEDGLLLVLVRLGDSCGSEFK